MRAHTDLATLMLKLCKFLNTYLVADAKFHQNILRPISTKSISNPAIQFILEEPQDDLQSPRQTLRNEEETLPKSKGNREEGTRIAHPWPEWVDLMEKLLRCGYFEAIGNPFGNSDEISTKDCNLIRTACLNFARDRFDLMRCNFRNFARNLRCLSCNTLFQERLKGFGHDQDHLPLKKGDWICDKCNFLNFAKNTRCLQCKENPPKRHLNPGEWECESCNYINFRRNMVCLKCDHRRPKASNFPGVLSQPIGDNEVRRRMRPTFGEEKQCADESTDMWSFVEGESKDKGGSNSWSQVQVPGFDDFPLLGGKSDLSRDVNKRERWKAEMAEKRRNTAKAREEADKFKSSFKEKSSEHLQCTDDEEMADWFGARRN